MTYVPLSESSAAPFLATVPPVATVLGGRPDAWQAREVESIADTAMRATCERRALRFARELLIHQRQFPNIAAIHDMAMGGAGTA